MKNNETVFTVRIHPIYHYFLVPVSLLFIPAPIGLLLTGHLNTTTGLMLSGFALILHLVVYLTREYAKRNQDRIIRNEWRLRYFVSGGNDLLSLEQQLTLAQLIALRFCSDEQLLELSRQSAVNKWTPEQIKQQIINGIPDHMRV
ncbi:MAG TPA: DUF6526 family protein [Bacteroidia bacterium]|nr:DUF6526 family protein [Bacteroidia bacterium]